MLIFFSPYNRHKNKVVARTQLNCEWHIIGHRRAYIYIIFTVNALCHRKGSNVAYLSVSLPNNSDTHSWPRERKYNSTFSIFSILSQRAATSVVPLVVDQLLSFLGYQLKTQKTSVQVAHVNNPSAVKSLEEQAYQAFSPIIISELEKLPTNGYL